MSECKAKNCGSSTNYSYNDYCSYHEKCLSKLREYKSISNIREIETFETWFNKNCGYVIDCDHSSSSSYPYHIWIVVFEPAVSSMSENMAVIKYKCGYGSSSGAGNKARRIKNKLQNNGFDDTPMLKVHPKAKSWEYFSNLITSPYVVKDYLPCHYSKFLWNVSSSAPSSAERYLKPLDIVWTKRSHEWLGVGYSHVGVYIGKDRSGENWMCHLDGDGNGAQVITWERFLKDGTCEELIRFHPIIPFKNYRKIAKQIAWATDGTPYRKNNYDLKNRNCEHFANMIVYGINYSKQIYNEFSSGNNSKGSTIKLTNEMSESNDKLGWITNELFREIERRYEIEVPTKDNCRIM